MFLPWLFLFLFPLQVPPLPSLLFLFLFLSQALPLISPANPFLLWLFLFLFLSLALPLTSPDSSLFFPGSSSSFSLSSFSYLPWLILFLPRAFPIPFSYSCPLFLPARLIFATKTSCEGNFLFVIGFLAAVHSWLGPGSTYSTSVNTYAEAQLVV